MLTVSAERDRTIFFELIWSGNTQFGFEKREVAIRGLEIGLQARGPNDGAYNTTRRTPVRPDRVIARRRCLTSTMHRIHKLLHGQELPLNVPGLRLTVRRAQSGPRSEA